MNAQCSFKFKIVVLLTILSLVSLNLSAHWTASGCVSDNTGNLYTDQAYSNPLTFETSPRILEGNLGYGNYCAAYTAGTCRIRSSSSCNGCTKSGNWWYQSGVMTYYLACPIDDYAGLIAMSVAGLGFILIRRNFLVV